MRLGRVTISVSYVIDLDDQNMVNHAKECVYEDVMNMVKYNEVAGWINTEEDPNASKEDIAEFLLPQEDEDY
jgi:hypothetical protein